MAEPETTGPSEVVHDETDEDASDAQDQVIASLRAQVTDLFSQVTQLNGKLVASYDRVSNLEDELHDASASLRNASVTISSLELERTHHLAALNTGLLVEKAHVTAELNRLMERATDEAAQRGQAESARRDIEKDLDDLSATLFDQANTMVAEARLNQARSERKVQDAEQALKIAEDAVKDMQVQMQTLHAEKEVAEREAREARVVVGKGKWVERDDARVGEVPRIRFMTTHAPYAEFIAFVAHLRGLRVSQPAPPLISTLLGQPFIARLINEDSEPTVRLDLAPSLNWLSRRSVLTAIHTGMLTVEPVSFSSLVQELQQHPQTVTSFSLSCALCGTLIARSPSTSPVSRTQITNGGSWFKYPLTLASTQNHNASTRQASESEPPGQVYIFRLAAAITSTPPPVLVPTHTSSVSMPAVGTSSRPPLNAISSSRVIQAQTSNSPYPLCTSNYCLTRLRSTCSLWAFVRVGIVERIWEEEILQPPKPHGVNGQESLAAANTGTQPTNGATFPSASEKPPVPPRRRRLWEMASALGERAVSWSKETGESVKENSAKTSLPPPPSHPSAPHSHGESLTSRADASEPPPLPKRSAVRGISTTDTTVPAPGTQNGVAAPETQEPTSSPNGHVDSDKTQSNPSDSPSTSVGEITFASPPSEALPSPPTASDPVVVAQPSTPPVQEKPRPSTTLPTPPSSQTPIARPTSPVLRPHSRLSSPASPPPSSRPTSPAIGRSRTGSPAPSGIARKTSPVPPSALPMWGKTAVPSPLASSRIASPAPGGPRAPPVPRRAAARRVVPPPPPPPETSEMNPAEEGKAEGTSSGARDPVPEGACEGTGAAADSDAVADTPGEGEMDVADAKVGEGNGVNVVMGETSPRASGTAPPTEAASQPVEEVKAGDARGTVNGCASHPHPRVAPEGDCGASVNTVSTKQSSSSEGEGEGFASDATWEERTWKELVRLKEEMFWARIGGIRALQDER